jgi:hypothetical protein
MANIRLPLPRASYIICSAQTGHDLRQLTQVVLLQYLFPGVRGGS